MRAVMKISLCHAVAPLLGAGILALAGLAASAQDTPPAAPAETPAAQAPAVPAPTPAPTIAPTLEAPAPAAPGPTDAPAPGAPAAEAPGTNAGQTPAAPADAAPTDAAGQSPASQVVVPATPLDQVATDAAAEDAGLPHDLSPWGMFMAADIVVKSVMVGLALASLVTWTVWLTKSLEIWGARSRMTRGRDLLNGCSDLAEARQGFQDRKGVVALMVRATYEETRASVAALSRSGGDGLKERVGSHLSRIEAEAGRRMTRGTSVLATIGSVAPFVGLFGTVWGIMNSFIGISQTQTTNLAVVAPGIAEALLATAMGLVAAIPAVVIYNHFARSITGYRQELADVSANIERMVSRDLDHGRLRAFDLAAE